MRASLEDRRLLFFFQKRVKLDRQRLEGDQRYRCHQTSRESANRASDANTRRDEDTEQKHRPRIDSIDSIQLVETATLLILSLSENSCSSEPLIEMKLGTAFNEKRDK